MAHLEGWTAIDGAYYAVITSGTIGVGGLWTYRRSCYNYKEGGGPG
jgi:hypothetical protein